MENLKNLSDEYHCRCFKINSNDLETFRKKLIEVGFEKQPGGEEDHGQVFGLRKKLLEVLQIHIKVLTNGIIEAELEPPPEYPGAHLNQVHSYSPHDGMPVLLDHIGFRYTIIHPIPDTCHLPTIIEPDRPLKWWQFLIIGLAAVGIGYLIYKSIKS